METQKKIYGHGLDYTLQFPWSILLHVMLQESLPSSSYHCQCGKHFCTSSGLWKHRKKCEIPAAAAITSSLSNSCPVANCTIRYRTTQDLRDHLEEDHGHNFKYEKKDFSNYEEFQTWKDEYEKDSISSFVKDNTNKSKEYVVEYFYCNRSGDYVTKSTGKRALKTQGSLKIDQHCTATMRVKIDQRTLSANLFICHTHYGHTPKLCHVPIPKSDKVNVAEKLIQGVPPQKILQHLFEENVPKLERKHLMDGKDIDNICRAYNLEKVALHKEDHVSVDAYVNSLIQKNNGTILVYKQQGVESFQYPKDITCILNKNDFALGLMTPFQKMMLQKYGSNIICLDATHGTNGYDFNLVTVLVIDDYGGGIPAAWFLCNREDGVALSVFFEAIRRSAGSIQPNVIMTDKASQYFSTWRNIFHGNIKKLLCRWHVIKDWNARILQIKDKEMAKTVYQTLMVFIDEQDPEHFENLLKEFLTSMEENDELKGFREYFVKEWYSDRVEWATCYRIGAGINTNMYLESFHKTFKYKYLKGKYNKRLDKCIVNLLSYSRDMIVQRIRKQEKGKLSWKASETHKRHRKAVSLPFNLVDTVNGSSWMVTSSKSVTDDTDVTEGLKFKVEKLENNNCDCNITCDTCQICVHTYTCSCPDYAVRTNICKHMHLVALKCLKEKNGQQNLTDNTELETGNHSDQLLQELNQDTSNTTEIDTFKNKLIQKLLSVCGKIHSCQSKDLLLTAESQINGLYSVLSVPEKTVVKNTDKLLVCKETVSQTKNIVKQGFFSTVKKRSKKNVRFAKPTWKEKVSLQKQLLGDNEPTPDHVYCFPLGAASVGKEKLSTEERKFLLCFISKSTLKTVSKGKSTVQENEVETMPEKIPDNIIDFKEDGVRIFFSKEAWLIVKSILKMKRKDWVCLSCSKVTTQLSMVECDTCKGWYHWECVSVLEDPGDNAWFCVRCQ